MPRNSSNIMSGEYESDRTPFDPEDAEVIPITRTYDSIIPAAELESALEDMGDVSTYQVEGETPQMGTHEGQQYVLNVVHEVTYEDGDGNKKRAEVEVYEDEVECLEFKLNADTTEALEQLDAQLAEHLETGQEDQGVIYRDDRQTIPETIRVSQDDLPYWRGIEKDLDTWYDRVEVASSEEEDVITRPLYEGGPEYIVDAQIHITNEDEQAMLLVEPGFGGGVEVYLKGDSVLVKDVDDLVRSFLNKSGKEEEDEDEFLFF